MTTHGEHVFSFDDDDDDGQLTRSIVARRWFVITAIVLFFIAAVLSPLIYLCAFIRRRDRRRAMILREMSIPAIQRVGIPAMRTQGDEMPRTWLQEPVVAALPTFVYKKGNDAGEDCSVCLGGWEEGEMAKMLPNCNHVFHVRCIDTWLYWHLTCPVCRARVEPRATAVAGEQQAIRGSSTPVPGSASTPSEDPPDAVF